MFSEIPAESEANKTENTVSAEQTPVEQVAAQPTPESTETVEAQDSTKPKQEEHVEQLTSIAWKPEKHYLNSDPVRPPESSVKPQALVDSRGVK